MNKCILFAAILILFSLFESKAKIVFSPIDYGIYETESPIQRYYCLYKCHYDALVNDGIVSYKGISKLYIEVPKDFNPIPLSSETDFANVHLIIKNNCKNCYLFQMIEAVIKTNIKPKSLQKGYLNEKLPLGIHMLIIEDKKPWVNNRKGYQYGFFRKDILLIEDGIVKNNPIQSYSTPESEPECIIVTPSTERKFIGNLNFERANGSGYMTFLFNIENQYNLEISGIKVRTPYGTSLYGDALITISNSALVNLNNITIDGTYSMENKFGYGLNLNNIYKLSVCALVANAKWGIFGTNNLQEVELSDCNINRFDIHCYGKNVRFKNCTFVNLYNQFSSIYGSIKFYGCRFKNVVPCLIESSFNAYTPFDISFYDCIFELDKSRNYIIDLFGLPCAINSRKELSNKALPNVELRNCTLNLSEDAESLIIFNVGTNEYSDKLDYLSKIKIINSLINKEATLIISNIPIKTKNILKVSIIRMKIGPNGKKKNYRFYEDGELNSKLLLN